MNEVKYEFMCTWQWARKCKDLSFVSIFTMMDCDFYYGLFSLFLFVMVIMGYFICHLNIIFTLFIKSFLA